MTFQINIILNFNYGKIFNIFCLNCYNSQDFGIIILIKSGDNINCYKIKKIILM